MKFFILALILGWLSAYGQQPTDATIAYRQEIGDIPNNLSMYDGVIAVLDCGRIGEEALLRAEGVSLRVMVFDCAGDSDGGYEWMIENNIAAEVGYYLWQEHPHIVGSRGAVKFLGRPPKTWEKQ